MCVQIDTECTQLSFQYSVCVCSFLHAVSCEAAPTTPPNGEQHTPQGPFVSLSHSLPQPADLQCKPIQQKDGGAVKKNCVVSAKPPNKGYLIKQLLMSVL